MNKTTLAFPACMHMRLKNHLFSGDNQEAAAILVCGRAGRFRDRLCVQEIIEIPYDSCSVRTATRISWPGRFLDDALDIADRSGATIILAHSHPGGLFDFSDLDDVSDAKAIPCLFHGMSDMAIPHGSAIMVPSGSIRARLYDQFMNCEPIERVFSIGSDIIDLSQPGIAEIMVFSSEMTSALRGMTVCIVGISGTGSIVAELIARLGVGKLILVDFDIVKLKNLNRILNSTIRDADAKRYKTQVSSESIASYRPTTQVVCIERPISDPAAIIAASDADVIFSCVDTMEGRYYCDLMASAFVTPLIDLGVTIPTRKNDDGTRAIAEICGRIDYVFPGGSSLGDREVWTPDGLRREYLEAVAPNDFREQVKAGYFKGVVEQAPSVISLNMRAASTAVNEWLFRMFKVRINANEEYARTYFSLVYNDEEFTSETDLAISTNTLLGRGLEAPLLGLPALSVPEGIAA